MPPKAEKLWSCLAKSNDPELIQALKKYHQEGKTNNQDISAFFLADYNIRMRYAYELLSSLV